MQTIFDWLTLGIFAGLAVIFLQRSVDHSGPQDKMISYLPPSLLLMGANYTGNKGMHILAIVMIVAALACIFYYIRPFERKI